MTLKSKGFFFFLLFSIHIFCFDWLGETQVRVQKRNFNQNINLCLVTVTLTFDLMTLKSIWLLSFLIASIYISSISTGQQKLKLGVLKLDLNPKKLFSVKVTLTFDLLTSKSKRVLPLPFHLYMFCSNRIKETQVRV